MDGSIEQKIKTLAALDSEGLGRLVRAKALKAMALHFMLQGVREQLGSNDSGLLNSFLESSLEQARQHRAG